MSLCINPSCPKPEHLQNLHNRYCQACGSDLRLNGHYRVMRLLSDNSGFGKIYEAFDQTTSKILKVLKENLNNNPKAVELFEQEAKVLKQLNHPGIPKVDGYFAYQTRNGLVLHCLVMEKIEGLNLEQWLQQQGNQPISQQKAVDWLKQLTKILDLVHKAEWFHRDIKPPNIMLRDSGQLVLIDFGTARDVTHTYLAKLGVGQNITAVYTPEYAPQEQMYGQAVPQSDFFALGRTFVYLLTGQSPLNFYDAYNDVLKWRQAAKISPMLANFLDHLMARKPVDRPLNTEILFKKIEDCERKLIQAVAVPQVKKVPQITAPQVKKNPLGNFALAQTLLGDANIVCGDDFLQISPDSSTLVSISNTSIKIWCLATGELIRTLSGHSSYVCDVAISPNGKTLVSGSYDKTIKIWNLETGKLIFTLSGHSDLVRSVAITPDGQTLASGSADKTIKIWCLKTGELIRTLSNRYTYAKSVSISPDGKTLVSDNHDNTIHIWNLGTGELIQTLCGYFRCPVALNSDGKTLVSCIWDNTIKVWNLETRKLIFTLSSHSDLVRYVAITPDGQTLASGSSDKTIKIWNLETGKLLQTLSGHSAVVCSVAISPDGQTLASGSADNIIKIWNLETRKLLQTLSGHSAVVCSVAISPDGQTLVSGDDSGNIKIWRVQQ